MCRPLISQGPVFEQYHSGNYEKVPDEISMALSSGDTAASYFYLKALSEIQLGQTDSAIRTLHAALSVHHDNARFSRMLAGLYFDAGDYPHAREWFLILVREDSSDIASRLKLAEISMFRQDDREAATQLQEVLLLDSVNLKGLMLMGEILDRKNDPQAIAYYQRALDAHPENQKAAYALGNLHIQSKEPEKAIPVFKEMLVQDTTSIRFSKLLGYAHYKSGNPGSAVRYFEYAGNLGDSSFFNFKFKGISQYLSVDFPGAIQSLRLAAEKDSMDAEVHFFLGASLATTREKREAMSHLNRSLELMQPDPSIISRIYFEQGNLKRLEGNYMEAYAIYKRAWEADSTQPMALYYMASIMDNSLHRSEEALIDYQRFIDRLDRLPETADLDSQMPTIRSIVEDRIVSLKEELFFLDQDR